MGQLKAPSNSDYKKIPTGRVIDKTSRVVHSAIFPFLRSNLNRSSQVAGNKVGLLGMKGKMELGLDGMVGRQESDGYEINIPMLDDPNLTVADIANAIINGNLAGGVKTSPNGHIGSIDMSISQMIGL